MQVLIRYYTGTGNTARAMGLLAEGLRAAGATVNLAEARFDRTEPHPEVPAAVDLLVLGCPTLGFSAPEHFLRWVDRLAPVQGKQAAVVGVCGAYESNRGVIGGATGALVHQVASRLRRKGYQIVATSAHSYPENWTQVSNPPDAGATARINAVADPGLGPLAADLVAGREPRLRVSPWALILSSVMSVLFRWVARRVLGKLYVADQTCTGCGLCARICPAGTIRMKLGRPAWGLDCDGCNRCINLCPTRSIQVSALRLLVHLGGNLVLTVVAVCLIAPWGPVAALALFVGGTVVQLTLLEAGLRALEGITSVRRLLAWGWTSRFRRYRAPGFIPGSTSGPSPPDR